MSLHGNIRELEFGTSKVWPNPYPSPAKMKNVTLYRKRRKLGGSAFHESQSEEWQSPAWLLWLLIGWDETVFIGWACCWTGENLPSLLVMQSIYLQVGVYTCMRAPLLPSQLHFKWGFLYSGSCILINL